MQSPCSVLRCTRMIVALSGRTAAAVQCSSRVLSALSHMHACNMLLTFAAAVCHELQGIVTAAAAAQWKAVWTYDLLTYDEVRRVQRGALD